jgi:hypothetical protein
VTQKRSLTRGMPGPLSLALTAILCAPASTMSRASELPQGDTFMIPDDTEVTLRLSEPLSSKHSYEGDLVKFTLDEDVVVNGILVAPKGERATGTVMEANRAGFVGTAGTLALRLDYFKVGDTKVPLRGWRFREGQSKTGAAIALALIHPVGLLKKGKETEVPAGTIVRGFVHGNTRVSRSALPRVEEK